MSRIEWDKQGERFYETGVHKGVLYTQKEKNPYGKGTAWNGLTGITESPSGAEANDLYADNIKYGTLRSAELFGATIEAYMYPDEFAVCDGSAEVVPGVMAGQQSRDTFGMAYNTLIGNDTATESDDGYKIHLIWGATASPSEKAYTTVNDSPEAITMSWEISTNPVSVDGHPELKPMSSMIINTLKLDEDSKAALKELEEILYGTDDKEPRLPLPGEIIEIFSKENEVETPPIETETPALG